MVPDSSDSPFADRSTTGRYSRRQLLAAVGGGTVVGGGIGAVLEQTIPVGREANCDGTPFATAPTDWPTPGYDRANTHHTPAESAPDTLESNWTIERDHDRYRTPVVGNGVIVVPGAEDDTSALSAFDLASGNRRWQVRESCCGLSPHSVTLAGDTVFFVRDDRPVALGLADGSPVWRGPPVENTSRPQILGGLGYVPERLPDNRTRLHVFDVRTGDRCETVMLPVDVLRVEAASPASVYANLGDAVAAISRSDWTIEWRHGGIDIAMYRDGRLFVSSTTHLVALAVDTGRVDWSIRYLNEQTGTETVGAAVPSYPELGAVTPDAVLVRERTGTDDSESLTAFDPTTSERLWRRTPPLTDGYAFSSPVAAGETVYTVTYDHERGDYRLLTLDIDTGERRDRLDLEMIDGAPSILVADGRVVVISETGLEVVGG